MQSSNAGASPSVQALLSFWKDYTTLGMQDMDVENQLLGPPPNGSASQQEEEPVHSKARKRRLLSACYGYKRAIIGIVISYLILLPSFFGLGTLLPSNCQKEAIKCPPDWIAYQRHCYKFSIEEKNWKESQNFCILHNASLAKIAEEEMDFVTKLTRNNVFWIGRKGGNAMLKALGNGGDCPYLNDGTASSGKCSTQHLYICKKN